MEEYKSVTNGQFMNYYNDSTGECCIAKLAIADEAISKGNIVCHAQAGTDNRYIIYKVKVPTSGNANDIPVGIAQQSATPVSVANHFKEIGHWSKAGATDTLTLADIHFN